MKIKLWIVSTCVPGETEPCQPTVFATEAAADTYADQVLRAEWETNGIEDMESGERLPYPGDWREANDLIAREVADGSWGEWQITSHEIEIGGADYQALARRLSDALLNARPLGGAEMFIKVGDEFYADPEYCAGLIHEHRMKEISALKEVAVLRKQVMALDSITPPGKLSIGLPGVDRMSLDAVAAEALEIVQEGDRFGERAQHATTIRTRQLLERLARAAAAQEVN